MEDWSNLSATLSPIVNGNNNSLSDIINIKNAVISAEKEYNLGKLGNDAIMVAGSAIAVKLGGAAIANGASALTPSVPVVGQISGKTQGHILHSKHAWEKVVNNPNNWNEVYDIVSKVIKNGTESAYGSATQKTLQIKNEIVVVTYKVVDGVIRISDAWVKTK